MLQQQPTLRHSVNKYDNGYAGWMTWHGMDVHENDEDIFGVAVIVVVFFLCALVRTELLQCALEYNASWQYMAHDVPELTL